MPALRVLGRKWNIAADDLPVPSLLGASWHGIWCILISIALAYVEQQIEPSCIYRKQHIGFLSTLLGCFAINTVLHTWTLFESLRGSMFQVAQRRRVGPLVLAVVIFYGLTIGCNAYGTHLVAQLRQGRVRCPTQHGQFRIGYVHLLSAVVVATWVGLLVGFIAMIITFNFFTAYSALTHWIREASLWRSLFPCCVKKDEEPDLPDNLADREGSGRRRGSQGGKDAQEGGRPASTTGRRSTRANMPKDGDGSSNMSPMVVIADTFANVFGAVDMTLSDYVAAFTLVGVRHRHAKLAWAYQNASPPAWIQAGGGNAGAGLGLPPSDPRVPMLEAPAVMDMAAAGSAPAAPGTAATPTKAPPSPPPAASPRVDIMASAREAPSDGAAPMAIPSASAAGAPPAPERVCGAALPNPGSHGNLVARADHASPPGDAAGAAAVKAQADGSVEAGGTSQDPLLLSSPANAQHHHHLHAHPGHHNDPPKSIHRVKSLAGGMVNLTKCTSNVFGASKLPSGETPSLVHPSREWNGVNSASNASIEVLDEAMHYMIYATAVYGWMMYIWMYRTQVTNCCRLCMGRSCGCCRQSSFFIESVGPDVGPSEGCCTPGKLMEREAITQLTGAADEDILYVCYENLIGGLLPYYIAIDRKLRSVVVGVRGSLSLKDVVTDLLCEAAPYDVPGVPSVDASGKRVMWAHRGILESALAIRDDILAQGVLAAAVAAWPEGEAAQAAALQQLPERGRAVLQRLRGQTAGWRVVITGHSLGGGVTGLLGPLLHQQFPNLRCWAFAPPAGLMSPKAAEVSRRVCIGVVHGKDMIPRLAVSTIEQLVQELVYAGVHCRTSKAWIFGRLVLLGKRPDQRDVFMPFESLHHDQNVAIQEYSVNLKACKVNERFDTARDFQPPGHLLYIERRKLYDDATCCSCNICLNTKEDKPVEHTCRWIDVNDLLTCGLVVSRSMFMDHLPDITLRAMRQALQQARAEAGMPPLPKHPLFRTKSKWSSANITPPPSAASARVGKQLAPALPAVDQALRGASASTSNSSPPAATNGNKAPYAPPDVVLPVQPGAAGEVGEQAVQVVVVGGGGGSAELVEEAAGQAEKGDKAGGAVAVGHEAC